ncbi:MAG: efflux transporter, family, subunit, partial [Gammaproteobacteria bacterium]|nr:efflux transporter, family, subunit [Gammaproteobacteria bacterium]
NVAFRLPPRGLVEVPAAALMFRASGTQVAHVGANGKIEFANVVIARDNGSLVELASGVQPGDRLVLNISSQIASGQSVAVNEPDAATKPLGAKR